MGALCAVPSRVDAMLNSMILLTCAGLKLLLYAEQQQQYTQFYFHPFNVWPVFGSRCRFVSVSVNALECPLACIFQACYHHLRTCGVTVSARIAFFVHPARSIV